MLPSHLEYFLLQKIATIFGNIPIIEKNGMKTVKYKNIICDINNHHNNLIGKVNCPNFEFYYLPITILENYDKNQVGINIYTNIDICPFCFGIQLPLDEQIKLYGKFNAENSIENNNIYNFIKMHYCFELAK